MKNAKKWVSVLLVVLMVFTCIPVFAFAQDAKVQNGDMIQFGNYPQNLVTDSKLVQALEKTPKKWQSYNYRYYEYEGSGTSEDPYRPIRSDIPTDYMQYADFSYNGKNYRGVNIVRPTFLTSRVHWPNADLYPDLKKHNEVYYFEYAPISWLVVNSEEGLVLSQLALDQQAYNDCYYAENDYYYTDETKSAYLNNYSESKLRAWLNHDFIEAAFTSNQVSLITKNNYALDEYFYYGDKYVSTFEEVTDKICIPTGREIMEFCKASIVASDYANMQGNDFEALTTRTAFYFIADKGSSFEVVAADTLEGGYEEIGDAVCCIMPMMKLSSLQNNTEMDLYASNAAKCRCFFHNTQHTDNVIVKFFVDVIKSIFESFSMNQYCDCGLRHY